MRFLRIPARLIAVVLATSVAAWAYIAPPIFTLAPLLADDAEAIHNYLHSAHPGTLSGFASHDYEDAMDDLAFELLKLSVGASTEGKVTKKSNKANQSFSTFKQTLLLEGLLPMDRTLKAMWKGIESDHAVLQTWFKVGVPN